MQQTNSHKAIYTFLLKLFSQVKSVDSKFKLARFIGETASKNYVGVFREPLIEDFLKDYSYKLLTPSEKTDPKNSKDQIVHIFTTTYQTGGHTRFVENLIQLDTKRTHHLLVTEQGSVPPRVALTDLINKNKGNILFLEESNLESKAKQFQRFILENAGRVMLHIHPYDLLPSLAIHAIKDKIEVSFFNHSDHCFSYGIDVADKVLNIRDEAHNITVHNRSHSNSFNLPLPIIKKEINETEKQGIRLKYGIEFETKVALSIGSAYKFQRKDNHYFFRTIYQAVEQHKDLKVLIIGLAESDLTKFILEYIPHERIQLLGIIEDPSELQAIADIVIDPMPFGSYTALLETSFYGAYPLVCYDTIPLFDLYRDPAFHGLIQMDINESDYLKHLGKILNGEVELTREQIKNNIAEYHCGKDWLSQYEKIMNGDLFVPSNEKPTEPDRLSFMNEDLDQVKQKLLSFFYENIRLFNKKEVAKIVLYLVSNKYKSREILGILKKYHLGH
jgi:hypothetical protein